MMVARNRLVGAVPRLSNQQFVTVTHYAGARQTPRQPLIALLRHISYTHRFNDKIEADQYDPPPVRFPLLPSPGATANRNSDFPNESESLEFRYPSKQSPRQ
jgi:hypothetical protein